MGADGSAGADAVVVVVTAELNTLVGSLLIVVLLPGHHVGGDIFVRTAGVNAVEHNLL